jgi:hypothetical protein
MKDGIGWQLMFQSPYIEEEIDRISINSKHQAIQTAAGLASTNPLLNSHSPVVGNINSQINSTPAVSSSLFGAVANNTLPSQIQLSTSVNSTGSGQSIENTKMCAVVAVAFDSNIRY